MGISKRRILSGISPGANPGVAGRKDVDLNFVLGEKPDVVFLECTERYLDSLVSHASTWNKD
jgi:hypothetical protein